MEKITRIYETRYYGIWVQCEDFVWWWIMDDRGGEVFYDHRPTVEEIDKYRDVVKI